MAVLDLGDAAVFDHQPERSTRFQLVGESLLIAADFREWFAEFLNYFAPGSADRDVRRSLIGEFRRGLWSWRGWKRGHGVGGRNADRAAGLAESLYRIHPRTRP